MPKVPCGDPQGIHMLKVLISSGLLYYILIIFLGHFSAHTPQFVHFSASMWARKFFTVIAPASQLLSQRRQPIHPVSHASMRAFPFSLELHCTNVFCLYGMSSIRCFGQAATHFPHALHASLSTTAIPSEICIASNGQASTQEPYPRHPYAHAFGPPSCIWLAIRKSLIP